MYVRKVKEAVLDFGHRGWLYEETFLFYDRKTDSLWAQATGEAVHGSYKGTRLDRLPATQTTWRQWRTFHPDTKVLDRVLGRTTDYWSDSYKSYYDTGKGITRNRYAPLHFGLAVILDKEQKLYPFDELAKKVMLVDQVAGQPVVVFFHSPSRTALAFDPRQRDRVLDFGPPQVTQQDVQVVDRQTGFAWSGLTGTCLEGAEKGAQLRQVTTTQFVVENWPLHYPKGQIFRVP